MAAVFLGDSLYWADYVPRAVLAVLLGVLARGTQRMPRWWVAFALLIGLDNAWRQVVQVRVPDPLLAGVLLASVALMIVWMVVDARPAFALAVLLLVSFTTDEISMRSLGGSMSPWWAEYEFAMIALILLVPAVLRIRRQRTL